MFRLWQVAGLVQGRSGYQILGIVLAYEVVVPKVKKSPESSRGPRSSKSIIQNGSPEDMYVEIALMGVREVAKRAPEFTSDDVHAWISVYCLGFGPPDSKFVAGVLKTATKSGICKPTSRINNRNLKVWQSLLHIPAEPER